VNHEPKVGEWVRVHWDNEHGHHTRLGLCVWRSATWYRIRFPVGAPDDRPNRVVDFESYSLEKLGLLEKLAIAADERYSGRMEVGEE
jgi:hypothetical protein